MSQQDKDNIIRLLHEPRIGRINYSLGNLRIRTSGYHRIRDAIQRNRITVERDDSDTSRTAQYDPDDNKIILSRNISFDTMSGKAVVIHELTHAIVDAARASQTTVLNDEAAGYISQCMYRMLHGERTLREWARANQGSVAGAIFHESIQLIDGFRLLAGSSTIPLVSVQPLRTAIRSHYLYRRYSEQSRTTANGI